MNPIRFRAGAVLCALAVAACSGTAPPASNEHADTTAPTPTAPQPSPSPSAPAPFTVRVDRIDLDSLDDAAITGARGTAPDGDAAVAAVENARRVLARYLNRVFLAPEERFTAAPLNDLLTPAAMGQLPAEHRAGLGVLPLTVRAARPAEPVAATARVVLQGPTVVQILVSYQARVALEQADGQATQLVQRGDLVFVPTAAGPRVEVVDATLEIAP